MAFSDRLLQQLLGHVPPKFRIFEQVIHIEMPHENKLSRNDKASLTGMLPRRDSVQLPFPGNTAENAHSDSWVSCRWFRKL